MIEQQYHVLGSYAPIYTVLPTGEHSHILNDCSSLLFFSNKNIVPQRRITITITVCTGFKG